MGDVIGIEDPEQQKKAEKELAKIKAKEEEDKEEELDYKKSSQYVSYFHDCFRKT
jgi:hypothetical protein